MDVEYPAHKKALEDGWLGDGKVIHHWSRNGGYPVSLYVVAFKHYNTGNVTIDCIRIFGGTEGARVQVSVDKRVRNWKEIFEE